jgi:hypothetical protein
MGAEVGGNGCAGEVDREGVEGQSPVFLIRGLENKLESELGPEGEDEQTEEASALSMFNEATGLGPLGYGALALSLVILGCTQTFGPGWAARLLEGGDLNSSRVQQSNPPGSLSSGYPTVPLDSPENLLN